MPDLLRLPHVGVEAPVDLGRVGQHRHQLEHVAVDLELDARHVVEDVAESAAEAWPGRGRCSRRCRGRSAGAPRPASRRALRAEPRAARGRVTGAHHIVDHVTYLADARADPIGWVRRPAAPSSRPPVLGSGMTWLDGSVVNVALRTIGEDLDASLAQLQWINNGYLVIAGLPDPARRLARGPARSPQDVRRRHRLVRAGQPAVRSRAQRRDPDRGPDPAGRRRRAADAGQPRDDPGRVRATDERGRAIGAWSGLGGVAAAIGPFVGGVLDRPRVVAVDLPDQPAARASSPW